MGNTKIKIWFAAFVITLATAGGAASYAAKEQMFYKGTEKMERAEIAGIGAIGQASVLDADRHSEPPLREDKLREESPATPPVIASEPRHSERSEESSSLWPFNSSAPSPLRPSVSPTPSPCATDNTLVIKDGKFAGCRSACEAEGKHTYVGPDRPGLLYGRCIECDTATFLINGGTCHLPSQ